MNRRALLLVSFVTLICACGFTQTTRILFLGNSYTGNNNLPDLVKNLALAGGDTVYFDAHIIGGYTFNQHSNDATAISKINAPGGWDFVVLQEQSQMPSFSPSQVATDVFPFATKLDSLIHVADSCATTVFYMTWGRKYGDASNCGVYPPVCTFEGMQQRLKESYVQMAQDNEALVAPCGEAWKASHYADSTIDLWVGDLSHPSLAGSYLTACTIYETIFGKTSVANTYDPGLGAGTSYFLQQKAHQTVTDSASVWNIGELGPNLSFTSFQTGLTVQFTNTSTQADYFLWDFGDGNFSTDFSPTHNYSTSGIYPVKLSGQKYCMTDSLTQNLDLALGIKVPSNQSFRVIEQGSKVEVSCDERFSVFIFSMDGKLLKSETFSGGNQEVGLGDLPNGLYILKIQTKSQVYTGRVLRDKE